MTQYIAGNWSFISQTYSLIFRGWFLNARDAHNREELQLCLLQKESLKNLAVDWAKRFKDLHNTWIVSEMGSYSCIMLDEAHERTIHKGLWHWKCLQIHLNEPPGDILLFLTGQEEIDGAKAYFQVSVLIQMLPVNVNPNPRSAGAKLDVNDADLAKPIRFLTEGNKWDGRYQWWSEKGSLYLSLN